MPVRHLAAPKPCPLTLHPNDTIILGPLTIIKEDIDLPSDICKIHLQAELPIEIGSKNADNIQGRVSQSHLILQMNYWNQRVIRMMNLGTRFYRSRDINFSSVPPVQGELLGIWIIEAIEQNPICECHKSPKCSAHTALLTIRKEMHTKMEEDPSEEEAPWVSRNWRNRLKLSRIPWMLSMPKNITCCHNSISLLAQQFLTLAQNWFPSSIRGSLSPCDKL